MAAQLNHTIVWSTDQAASARFLAERLPACVPVDLMGALARPWSTALALRATGAPPAYLAANCQSGGHAEDLAAE